MDKIKQLQFITITPTTVISNMGKDMQRSRNHYKKDSRLLKSKTDFFVGGNEIKAMSNSKHGHTTKFR